MKTLFPESVYIFSYLKHFLLHFTFKSYLVCYSDWLGGRSWLWLGCCEIIKKFNGCRSFFGVKMKAPVNYFLCFLTYLHFKRKSMLLNFFENFCHISTIIKGLSIKTFIESHSKSPNFWFFAVLIFQESFRSHVWRRANIILQTWFIVSLNLTISKIYDLYLTIVE